MEAVGVGEGGGQLQAVNPDCPNAANPFHRCAEYCPVPPPRVAAKSPPPPPPPPQPGREKAEMNGTAHLNGAERDITADSDEISESPDSEDLAAVRRTRSPAKTPARDEVAGGGGEQWKAVNPDCPNAANPFHRCAEYCPVPVPVPRSPVKMNGSAHSDGDLHPRPRRRDKGGGSGGLPLYVFLREGADGEGKKVDPRCPNAPNPFHVCTDHCLAKMAEAGRSSEGGSKSPLSIFSRHSRRSSSSSEEGSVKSGSSRKVDPKCPNAGNPFHECGEYCAAKMQQVQQQKATNKKSPLPSPRKKAGGKDAALVQNWKVDPRCPNAGNPFHICAQYCFDHLNEAAETNGTKSDKKKGKTVSKEAPRGEINPDCPNASNPYHQCGEYCKRKGER